MGDFFISKMQKVKQNTNKKLEAKQKYGMDQNNLIKKTKRKDNMEGRLRAKNSAW